MNERMAFDAGHTSHFVTTTCFKKRRLLDDDRCKGVVIHVLASQLAKQGGTCQGFVIMPEHAHAVVWFPQEGQLSVFMKQWKQRSSILLKKLYRSQMPAYLESIGANDPVWQRHYYSFNVTNEEKLREKLRYMHHNPVKRGLVKEACEWRFGSVRHYEQGRPVGVEIVWPGR